MCYSIDSILCFGGAGWGVAVWPRGMWDLSFLIRDQTLTLGTGRQSEPLDYQGSPTSAPS